MRRLFSPRPPRAHNDNEYSGLRFGPETAREMLAEKVETFRSFWKEFTAPRIEYKLEDYDGIFSRQKTAKIITLSPSRKGRKK